MRRASGLPLFGGQLRALAWKTLLVAVIRHPISFIIKAYLLPIAIVAVLLNIPKFTTNSNVNGVGTPIPLPSLAETITKKPLYIVKTPGLGPDVDEVITKIIQPLRPETVRYLDDERDLLAECLANLRGISGCHASITFTDSPQTTSFDTIDSDHHWNYTIRADPARQGVPYNVLEHDGDLERLLLPLQVAVENAMTNSTTNPATLLFTSKTQKEWDETIRSSSQELVANMYGFAFFLGFIQQLFHLTRLITQEREAGMSQLVDSMGGNSTARVLSYLAVFNVIYFPLWVVLGALHWNSLWPTSNPSIPIIWQVLLGLAVNSSTVFAASFFRKARTAPVYVSGAFLIMSIGALLTGLEEVSTVTVAAISLFFPSSNHFFFVQFMSYWEYNLQPAILGDIPPPAFSAQRKLLVTGSTLLSFLVVAIVGYPPLAILTEKIMYVYKTPDSASAGRLATKLAADGVPDVSIVGPQVEDVFLRVTDDLALVTNTDPMSPSTNFGLGLGKTTSFWSQMKTLLWKRIIVLKRFWWPYIYVLGLPIVVTPSFSDMLKGYIAPLCADIQPTLYSAHEFYVSYGGGYMVEGEMRTHPGLLLGGPPWVNESLYSLMNKNGSMARYFNMSQYAEWVRPVETLDGFTNYLKENKGEVLPGGIFMESKTSNPVIASFAEFGVVDGMTLFNLYSQIRSDSQITASYGPMAVYPAAFALYPSVEKSRKVRSVGYANGVRRAPLWVAYALFDFFFVAIISIAITSHLGTNMPLWTGGAWVMLPILALYGLTGILFSYIMSVLCKTGPGAFLAISFSNVIMFTIVVVAFAAPNAFVDVTEVDDAMKATTFALNIFFPIGNVFKSVAFGLNVMEISCGGDAIIPASSMHAYGGPVLYLIVQVATLLGILIWLEGYHSSCKAGAVKHSPMEEDSEKLPSYSSDDVKVEKLRVEETTEDPLRTLHLTKSFDRTLAVDDISLGIGKSEVLAIIGPNGAGKSTLINLIRGDLIPDHGNGYLCGDDANSDSAQKHLGVCAQYDALDLMSTEEHLDFFARIKGIDDVQQNVDTVMAKLGLTQYATRSASKLSGGNKRKLSTPPVLVLDEPTSAMDAVAKRAFWKIIQQISPNRSVLLTTHSMEEADTLAHRAAVMSRRVLAIGTTRALRQRYSNLYYVRVLLRTAPLSTAEEMASIRAWVEDRVPGTTMEREALGGQISFTVPGSRNQDVEKTVNGQNATKSDIGTIFDLIRLLEESKKNRGIEYYSIGGATLERVFLNVVKENGITADEDQKIRKRWWAF
ncbi:nod factor export ATP-binding protein I [Colletotrichum tabaci]|uniref:Nod factor export ATP-binding protein I n=1 Tax=Colletotrichum tabaci TaxID=1209068 RepID=A0AAV9TVH3_9PEZI